MKKIVIALATFLLVFNSCSKPDGKGSFKGQNIQVWGQMRSYNLYVSDSVDLSSPSPLVFAYHGLKGTPSNMANYSKLEELADQEGFILIFPKAVNGQWGGEGNQMWKDLQFFDKIVRKTSDKYNVDVNRIYAIGMSNGGTMCHKLAQKRSEVVAAICSHSGVLGLEIGITGINADRKTPVLIAHGDKDWLIPVKTARKNRDRYIDEGHPVVYHEIPDLGHNWGTDYSINDSIWDFFKVRSLDQPLLFP